jgi:hypothetical protein
MHSDVCLRPYRSLCVHPRSQDGWRAGDNPVELRAAARTHVIITLNSDFSGKDDQLAIDSGPWGCKGYKQAVAAFLKDKNINVRTCSCEADKEQAGVRKQRRIDLQDVNVRSLLGAPPAKQCQRFIKGICILNKKGKKCSSSHDIPDLWEISPNGKQGSEIHNT